MSTSVAAPVEEPIHELNTTPLIDVMLVLLIMFIITIPIQTHAVDVDLPGRRIEPRDFRTDVNKVAIDPGGAARWNGGVIGLPELRATLNATTRLSRPPELQVEPHPEARYEKVDEVLAVIRRADVPSMGFVGNERYRNF
ncbi:MAG TPA: biopolymer transporter ExbD [Allosphingosinicella sp.]